METNENCSTEEVKPLICKEIESEGFVKTWEKYNVKHKTYFKATSWLSGLMWLPFAVALVICVVKFFQVTSEDFSQLELSALYKKRDLLVKDLCLWANLFVALFFIDTNLEAVPKIIKSITMSEWVKTCEFDLTEYIKRQKNGSQEVPYDMGVLSESLYLSKNNNARKFKLLVAVAYFVISLILSIIMFASMNKTITLFLDIEIYNDIGPSLPEPSLKNAIAVIVALALSFIAEIANKIIDKTTNNAVKKWAETV